MPSVSRASEWHPSPAQPLLVLRRDPVGHESLFYGRGPDGAVYYSARLKDVIEALHRPALCPSGLATYLSTGYVPAPGTLLQGICAVPPGGVVRFDTRGEQTEIEPLQLPVIPEGLDAQRALLRTRLEEAVLRALPAGPCAASLSGGIDSSLVLALASRHTSVRAFSLAFGPEHRDELAWSSLVARHLGVEHEIVTVTPEMVRRRFDETVLSLSIPNGDPLTVPNDALFAAAASRGCGVVLNGEGGDPCFGGPKNAPMLLAELYGGGSREDAYLRAHQKLWDELDEALARPWLPDALRDRVRALVTPHLEPREGRPLLDRLMALNVVWKGAGHILPKVERLAASHGVSARSPLFDPEVVALALALPPEAKRRGPVEKWLLKEAVRDLLPDEIIERPKSGMLVPVEAWFAGPLREWARERLIDGLGPRKIFDERWLVRLADKEIGGLRPRHGVKVWLLLTLEAWMRVVLESDTRVDDQTRGTLAERHTCR